MLTLLCFGAMALYSPSKPCECSGTRIENSIEQYHHHIEMVALIMRKNNPNRIL